MTDIRNLDTFERNQVLEFLLHHMPMEVRGKFIESLPVHYGKLHEMDFERVCEIRARSARTANPTTANLRSCI